MVIFLIFITIFVFIALFIYQGEKKAEIPTMPEHPKPEQQSMHLDLKNEIQRREPVEQPKVKRLRYFCIKDKGYHISVWPKDQGFQGIDYIEFNIAGITYCEHIDDHLGEFIATLKPDPANPYDANAIKILTSNGDHIGYVPKDMIREVRNFTNLPCKCYCYIGVNDSVYFSCCYITNQN